MSGWGWGSGAAQQQRPRSSGCSRVVTFTCRAGGAAHHCSHVCIRVAAYKHARAHARTSFIVIGNKANILYYSAAGIG